MTYKKLSERLRDMTDRELNQDVTFKRGDEYYPARDLCKVFNSGILNEGHSVISSSEDVETIPLGLLKDALGDYNGE